MDSNKDDIIDAEDLKMTFQREDRDELYSIFDSGAMQFGQKNEEPINVESLKVTM